MIRKIEDFADSFLGLIYPFFLIAAGIVAIALILLVFGCVFCFIWYIFNYGVV